MKKRLSSNIFRLVGFGLAVLAVAIFSVRGLSGEAVPAAAETTAGVIAQSDFLSAEAALADASAKPEDDIQVIAPTAAESSETAADPDTPAGSVAAMRIDGQIVPMTYGEIADFEEKLFQCKTPEEYEAMMSTLAYYNKGVDMSRFSWYWDDLADLYSDEQIAMMRDGTRQMKVVPNLVGMEARAAYQYMTDLGFLIRFAYYHNSDSDLPVGTIYYQDIEAGSTFNTDAAIMASVQAPREISYESVIWDPDDTDFDINAIAADIRENGRYSIAMPDVVGLTAEEARATLEAAGYRSVEVVYLHTDRDAADGCCYEQLFAPGTLIYNTHSFWIHIQEPLAEETTPAVTEPPATEPAPELTTAPSETAPAASETVPATSETQASAG
ncbi:MAG TPA: hypothetical protein DD640_09055 [Clostridiales bacterium]|nr:hypothetical protein [Clostridiales bacterium]